jgi:chromosome partitioning protein
MIITVASYKGGVGKTTTAVHLAAYLQTLEPTLLLDGDQTRNATGWSERGDGFPFKVALIDQAAKLARHYKHVVIDTGKGPSVDELKAAADGCDLLVVPTIPDLGGVGTDGLGQTVRELQSAGATFRVLLTSVPPDAVKEAADLRHLLAGEHAPVFASEIPRLKAFKKADAAGCIVWQAKDRESARAWESYAAIGRQLELASTQQASRGWRAHERPQKSIRGIEAGAGAGAPKYPGT